METRPKAVLVGVQLPHVSDEEHAADMAELGRLVHTLGLHVLGTVVQKRGNVETGTVLGEGKLQELAMWTGGTGKPQFVPPRHNKLRERQEREEAESDVEENGSDDEQDASAWGGSDAESPKAHDVQASIVVVDHELSPRQQRNLERATGAEVLDRSSVIVEIFHRHAKSREAKLQVEIARLSYVAPRLREAGAGADRQRGGIGGKGAGESALELDRRRIRDRVAELKNELERIQNDQATRRAGRKDARRISLVGYTNAGKSSLMRALTGSEVLVEDKLFATLDTTVRTLKPETDPRILVSDTVGFIKKLPHQLVASFRSTLDEALEASLLLYVVDASDPTFRSQLEVSETVLAEIGADTVPSKLVLNKRDRLDDDAIAKLRREFPEAIVISAKVREDIGVLRDAIVTFFDGALVEEEVFVPYAQQKLVHRFYEGMTVLGERHDELGTHVRVRAPAAALERLRSQVA